MIAVIVAAHKSRAALAEELAERVSAEVVMDDGALGALGNHRQALTVGLASAPSHIVVLEDDALPVSDFTSAIEAAIAERPDQMIGLYLGTGKRGKVEQVTEAIEAADKAGATWLTHCDLLHGVGTIWPAAIAQDFLDSNVEHRLFDVPLSEWLRDMGHEVAYTWPSLVDHRDEPSLIPPTHRLSRVDPGERRAYRVGMPEWGGPAVVIRNGI